METTDSGAPGLIATARALATDRVCADVVSRWRAEGIEEILLKGSTIADWLYPGEVRGYVDVDLLVAPERVMDAAALLARIGFVAVDRHVSLHAHPWVRASDDAQVDLHVTLWGASRSPDWVWRELQSWLEIRPVGRVPVRVLNLPARALHVALHAAQHGDVPKPREDLVRAVSRAPVGVWRDAERLAHRLGSLNEMAEALLLDPAGERLLQQLPLARAAAIAGRERAPLAIGFARLSEAPGWREKVAVLARAFFRPREELSLSLGGLPDSRAGLVAAYARNTASLLAATPGTLLALWRARRRAR
jgi:hypothetical protein